MTPNEITTLIATNFDREMDVPFKKQLYERVKYWRGTLIKQALDRNPAHARFFRQTIFMKLEKVDSLKVTAELKCFAAQTVDTIPLPLRTVANGALSYFGGVDGISPFGYADAGTRQYLLSGKYAHKLFFYDYINHRGVVTQLPELPMVRIDGIFDSPEDAMPYQSIDGPDYNCDWWNIDIPMSSDITQRIVQCILTVDYARPDDKNDHQITVNEPNKQ